MEVGNIIGWVGKMEENTELEEGEACFNKDCGDSIDMDSLSYFDERIEHALGHFQKDFEGGVCTDNLGAKFGGYGSFLPAYECSPSRSHLKTSQKNYMPSKSSSNHHLEAAPDNSTAAPHVPPSTRLGTVSNSINSLKNGRAVSVDDLVNKGVGVPSNIGGRICSLNDDSTNKSGKPPEQRTLKFRIKMKSDNLAQKNAALYSGLGLDISSSSSMDESPIQTGGILPVSQQTGEESPTSIIQALSSFSIPGSVLISPLNVNMLYLTKREKIHGDRKTLTARKGQEPCSMSTDESDSILGEEDLLKKQKRRLLHPKKRLGKKTPERKDFLLNNLKGTPLISSFCDAVETAEVNGKVSDVSKRVNKDVANGRMRSTESVEEELKSMSGQDFDKSDKKHTENGSMQKIIECKPASSLKNNSVGSKHNGSSKGSVTSQKAEVDAMKCYSEGSQKVETNKKGKPLSDSNNKSKGDQSPSKAVAVAKRESFDAGNNETVNNRKSSGFGDNFKSKIAKTKPLKDNNVGGNSAVSSKRDEQEFIFDGKDPVEGSTYDDFTDGSAYKVKIKGRQNRDKMEKLIPGLGIKDALNAYHATGKKCAPEMIQMAAAPQHVEDNWVCCDRCQKWRLLPVGIKPEQLPEKWLCSMLNWLPGMNRCDISEEMTTKALYASWQTPTTEGLNNIENNVSGAAIGVGSADAQELGLSHQNSNSDTLPDQRKKKLGFMGKKKAEIGTDNLLSSDSTQNHTEESGKIPNRQHTADEHLTRKSFSQHGKVNSLMEVKHFPRKKEMKINGGDGKQGKLKRKLEAYKYQPGTLKKPKTADIYISDTQLSPGTDLEMASGKGMQRRDEYFLSEDGQDKLVGSGKKQGYHTQVLSNGGSLDQKCHSKKVSSFKKRKLEDWQKAEKLHMSLQDDKQNGEVSTSGSRKEKKFKVIHPEAKSFTESGYKIKRRGEMNQVCLSGSKNHAAVGAEVGSVDKVYPQRRHTEKVASHKVLDDVDTLGRDLGSGLLSLTATSSSSKVSGSHKCRTNYADVKCSPVESVTSSPLRIPNDREGKLTVKLREERVSCDLHSESLRSALIGSGATDGNKAGIQAKTSDPRDNHLLNFDVPTVRQHGDCANFESRVTKCNQGSQISSEKSGKVISLKGKEENKRSASKVERSKTKVSSENGHLKSGGRLPNYDAFSQGSKINAKCSFAQSKCEVKKNSAGHWPSEIKIEKQTEPSQKDFEKSDLKVDVKLSPSNEILSQKNLEDLKDGHKADTVCTESRDGKSKVLLSSIGEEKRETLSGSRTSHESRKGDTCIERLIDASINDDAGRSTKIATGTSGKGGVNYSSGASGPNGQLPVRTDSSQTAYDSDILKEASNLKDRADHFKSSGFEFESNETFFEAALKFLHGASLLENFHKESNKHGNISPLQAYTSAAKLFDSCAQEYERHNEIAAAALAYKCMEVAYMRVVYSKHSSINRDRNELQSTLQMVPQGESPSSSASDVDNLNSQAAVDKCTLLRVTGTHVAGNQVISSRHASNCVRLLDFTQDVDFAMEASRKCQSAFAAANMIMEEVQNGDCITSMRRVINFSFQDVDELVGLVSTAMKAISRAHLGGARD